MDFKSQFKAHWMKKWEAALLLALCAAALTGMWAAGRGQKLADKLIRLHVVAVSDSERDQSLKLMVRDRVLEILTPELGGLDSRESAAARVTELLPEIEGAAREVFAANGVDCGAVATIGRETYPTRYYDGFALPAGDYLSLRVILGAGEGQNWWCVVFPPLCAAAAEGIADVSGELDGGDMALITEEGGYEIRFRLLELWGELKQLIASKL